MARANPPPQKLPDDLERDLSEIRGLFTYLEDTQFQQYQMWKRSGAGDDFFETINSRLDAIEARLDAIEARLDAIELRLDLVEARVTYLEGLTVVTAVGVTTEGNTTIICTAPLTVTLALTPLDRDTVSIKAQNGDKIIIDGNGNTIDGQATLTIRTNKQTKIKTGLTMQYSSEVDGWSLI